MSVLMGENVTLGVGLESTRGTAVAPAYWIPARSPSGIRPIVEKAIIREARGTGVTSQASEIVRQRAEGDVQFNVRTTGIGYLLKSLFGSVGTVSSLGSYTHTFNIDALSAQHPSLTLGLAQPGQQDYRYPLGVVSQLEINTPIDDLVNATAAFIASKEEAVADYTPTFVDTNDVYFRNHDITFKIAANVAGLGAATPICIKESSLTIAMNTRPNNCVGASVPVDILSLLAEITGNFTIDYDGTTHRDNYVDGNFRALQIEMVRDDLAVLGTSTNYHTLRFVFPKVSFEEYTPERPIDDIVTEALSYTAHYDSVAGYAARAILINATASY